MNRINDSLGCDILPGVQIAIIGSGGAGMTCALELAKHNINVACISKSHPRLSHTSAAQGGINASIGSVIDDMWEWHAYDTIKGGHFLSDHDAVNILCQESESAIKFLLNIGVEFDRTTEGKINQRKYGGHTTEYGSGQLAYRTCTVKDYIGKEIVEKLYASSINSDIQFLCETFVIDIIFDDAKTPYALMLFNIKKGSLSILPCSIVVIATGGYAACYSNNTNTSSCTGDGNAILAKHGFQMQDMEFIQFHPTTLYKTHILVSEACRSEGGVLLNKNKERFMARYSPQLMEMAPRDTVSKAIYNEIANGNGCGEKSDHILLDLSHMSADIIQNRLPSTMYNAKTFANIDVFKEPIPILPGAHYTMGGIAADVHGRVRNSDTTHSDHIFAIGESACLSVHGANRLGCNSLLDLIVFGKRAAEYIASNNFKRERAITEKECKSFLNKIHTLKSKKSNLSIDKIRKDIQATMSQYCGIIREESAMLSGLDKLWDIRDKMNTISLDMTLLPWNGSIVQYYETENMLIQSIQTLSCALWRKESRGSHFRSDFPNKNDPEYGYHSICNIKDLELKNDGIQINRHKVNTDDSFNNKDKRSYQ